MVDWGGMGADDTDDAPERETWEAAFPPPAGGEWQRVSPRLTWYYRIACLVGLVVLAGAGAFGLWRWSGAWGAGGWIAAVAAVAVICWLLAGRHARALGYAEGDSDFYLTHGVVVRQLVVIPYGRMQLVDVSTNLFEQALGLATVRIRTAASPGEATVVGLPMTEASGLRDRLTERSEAYSTGL